jgi:hypothetical protein
MGCLQRSCVVSLVISLTFGFGLVRGDDPEAPLNGAVSFDTASAASDTLYVISGTKTIRATEAEKLQGHADSRIAVVTTADSGTVRVADVVLRDGDSLYKVTGAYAGGSGGTAAEWTADYNKGGPRILLEINEAGESDNNIACGYNGGILMVTVAGGSPGAVYPIVFTRTGAGTPSGDLDIAGSPPTYVIGSGTIGVRLDGVEHGGVSIVARDQNSVAATSAPVNTTVVKLDRHQFCLSAMGTYVDLPSQPNTTKLLMLLNGTPLFLKALSLPADVTWPHDKPAWGGTFGTTGTGATTSHAYAGPGSTSDNDHKTITVECGNTVTANVLACDTVLGVHSSIGPNAIVDTTDGHAWITVTAAGIPISYGLWPDDHPDTVNNGPGWDIRTNMEPPTGLYNRYHLLRPSQKTILLRCLAANVTWAYTHNCSSWASDTAFDVTGEDINADDIVFHFETPREFGTSIRDLEQADPSSPSSPKGNGSIVE